LASPNGIWERLLNKFDLSGLTEIIDNIPEFKGMVESIKSKKTRELKAQIIGAAKPLLVSALWKKLNSSVLLVTSTPENARKLYDQLQPLVNQDDLFLLPDPDILPYQRAIIEHSVEQERIQILFSILTRDQNKPSLVICSAYSLMQPVLSKDEFFSACHVLEIGMEIDPLKLFSRWEGLGYKFENLVELPGAISRRGNILDIYPSSSELPVRMEFFGDTIESIRLFDPSTQRSQKIITRVTICPANETFNIFEKIETNQEILDGLDFSNCSMEIREQFEKEIELLRMRNRIPGVSFYAPLFYSGNLLDYFENKSLVILDDSRFIQDEIENLDKKANHIREEKIASGELPANYPVPYFDWINVKSRLELPIKLFLESWKSDESTDIIEFHFDPPPNYAGQLQGFLDKITDYVNQGARLILVSNQASRIAELLEGDFLYCSPVAELKSLPLPGTVTLVQGSLNEGWTLDNTLLLTDKEIFGFVKERRLLKKRPVKRNHLMVNIKPGDYVVHVEHGIGYLSGVVSMNNGDTRKEYLVIQYAGEDKLYVPTDQIDRVARYIGAGEKPPALSRLGTQEWNRTRQRVKESVAEIAHDLLQLYAAREILPGFAFSPDTVWQKELEASFPYIETPDQVKVQEEVKADMERARPMDRLVVGDVGYGKTEIAIRAAFKAVMDNKQVAVLVPTTILAEQHFITFKQRMAAFPVMIDILSRFRKPAEQKKVLEGIANGSIDICIGTHRLLQKDVVFKDLGLLIIDEEQRFGVAHKEYLKKMQQKVDVLTLSATPIPRTLHMSLIGVRDMSVIETPPENRLPVKTYVAEYSDQIVKDAILREIERGGQVFFVHNRVQGIAAIATRLQNLLPEVKIDVAHGQLPEDKLEQVMLRFQNGETNVLVCTTIIESGLDMPNVNTLIVNQADRFGLTQLYQLRGRIGRGSNSAYAYFLYNKNKKLTDAARKRLQTIFEATELGAGFGIALKDLEIRGAGVLLGTQQSGNISAVGFNLYTQLLAEAIEEQRSKLSGEEKSSRKVILSPPSIDLPLKAYIPDSYIPDLEMRLHLYQKLAQVSSLEGIKELKSELEDRFGLIPPEVDSLLYVLKLKALGSKARVESISTRDSVITLRLHQGEQFSRRMINAISALGVKAGISQVIINLNSTRENWQKLLERVLYLAGK